MKMIDLTHTIQSNMPVYPGTDPPEIHSVATIEGQGFAERKLSFFSHTGTHIDAPAHMLDGGMTLEQFPVSHFVGQAVVIHIPERTCRQINAEELNPYGEIIEACDYVLFHTGWENYWGKQAYFSGYPVLTDRAAQWLTGFKLKGVGFDTLSPDRETGGDFSIHHIFFEAGILIVENLTGLDVLKGSRFQFNCLPMKFDQAEGAPVRAIAILE